MMNALDPDSDSETTMLTAAVQAKSQLAVAHDWESLSRVNDPSKVLLAARLWTMARAAMLATSAGFMTAAR